MAKSVSSVSIWLTSANSEYNENGLFARYRVTDGDLSKNSRWAASGVDLTQPLSGVWTDIISTIETLEGI